MTFFTENQPLVLAIATFLAIIFLYWAIASYLTSRRKDKAVIERAKKWSTSHIESEPQENKTDSEITKTSFLNSLRRKKKKEDEGIYSDTPLFYQRAGIYNKNSIQFYRGVRLLLLLGPAVVAVLFYVLYNRPVTPLLLLIVCFFSIIGYFLPVMWLKFVAMSRKKGLNRTFPDAMDLLMVCVEAGMGIDAAIRRVSKEIVITSPELAKEFKILSLELKTGRPRNSCLKNLARRTNLPDIDSLVSLLIQAERYGTGVANALKIHAEEMRQRRYARLEEQAEKLPVKLIVPLILFIFPALFVVIAGPTAIQVFRVIIQG